MNRSRKAAAQVRRTLYQGQLSSVCQQEHVYCILRYNNFSPFFVVVKDEYKIENFATREVQSVIGFLKAKNFRPAEIHRQNVETHDEGAMKEENASKRCLLFKVGGNNLCDVE